MEDFKDQPQVIHSHWKRGMSRHFPMWGCRDVRCYLNSPDSSPCLSQMTMAASWLNLPILLVEVLLSCQFLTWREKNSPNSLLLEWNRHASQAFLFSSLPVFWCQPQAPSPWKPASLSTRNWHTGGGPRQTLGSSLLMHPSQFVFFGGLLKEGELHCSRH